MEGGGGRRLRLFCRLPRPRPPPSSPPRPLRRRLFLPTRLVFWDRMLPFSLSCVDDDVIFTKEGLLLDTKVHAVGNKNDVDINGVIVLLGRLERRSDEVVRRHNMPVN
mmetsp:Transcript_4772/g.5755  ORF Transcript_4772/g.5755 Transcript_4772/m.5755 type:complete len:108 (+) Transcript_4772:848-1171(+)